jgi:hypothetical protein
MTQSSPLSPRQEALNSILQVRATYHGATLDTDTWDKIVGIAWDSRMQTGDRRDIQRSLREILLDASRTGGGDDATA